MTLPIIDFDEPKHAYKLNGEDVPGVTSIIKTSDPFEAGPWWGMRVGMAAVVQLLKEDHLTWPSLMTEDPDEIRKGYEQQPLEKLVIAKKLSTNHLREQRGDEGSAVHLAIEAIKETGELPSLTDFDEELRGYLRAFAKFVYEQEPEFIDHEMLVAWDGSEREHVMGMPYCGKLDNTALVGNETWPCILDYKTQAKPKHKMAVYESHHLQGRGYVEAYNWIGHSVGDPDFKEIEIARTVVLGIEGDYLMQASCATPEYWFWTLGRHYERERTFKAAFNKLKPKAPSKRKAKT
jgi:hypothetical protein